MKYRFLSVAAYLSFLFFSASAQPLKFRPVHLGFVYPISSNGFNAREYTNGVSLHAIAGISRSETSLCASGFSNIIHDRGTGVVVAGFSNHIGNHTTGLQAAGFLNTVRNDAKGLQASGFLNLAGSLKGMQAAGFCNIVLHNTKGFQTAGFCNLNLGHVRGLQASGFLNLADNVEGAQASGFVNIADDINTQIAGFVNIAREVKSVQIAGFINIADSCDYPIGPVNLIKNGTKAIGATINSNGSMLAAFRSGGRVLYGVLGAGYTLSDIDVYVLETGIGAHLYKTSIFNLNVEGVSEAHTDFYTRGTFVISSLRLLPSLRFGNFEAFAGPAISHVTMDRYANRQPSDNYIWSHSGRNSFTGVFVGGVAGLQYHF